MANSNKRKPAIKKEIDMSDVISPCEKKPELNLNKTTAGNVWIDDTALINVKSNVFGELIYIDPVTKEKISWQQCGEILQLPLATLRHMKNGAVKFFTNQLILITGFADENAEKYEVADIYKCLYISQYYNEILDPANYDDICNWKPSDIKEKVSMLSSGAKGKLIVALNTYIEKGLLDSLKTIRAFEEALGCDLRRAD